MGSTLWFVADSADDDDAPFSHDADLGYVSFSGVSIQVQTFEALELCGWCLSHLTSPVARTVSTTYTGRSLLEALGVLDTGGAS